LPGAGNQVPAERDEVSGGGIEVPTSADAMPNWIGCDAVPRDNNRLPRGADSMPRR